MNKKHRATRNMHDGKCAIQPELLFGEYQNRHCSGVEATGIERLTLPGGPVHTIQYKHDTVDIDGRGGGGREKRPRANIITRSATTWATNSRTDLNAPIFFVFCFVLLFNGKTCGMQIFLHRFPPEYYVEKKSTVAVVTMIQRCSGPFRPFLFYWGHTNFVSCMFVPVSLFVSVSLCPLPRHVLVDTYSCQRATTAFIFGVATPG